MTRDDLDAVGAPAVAAGPRAGRTDAGGGAGSAAAAGRAGRAPHQVAGVLLVVRRPVGSRCATSCSAIAFIWRRSRRFADGDWTVGDLGCGTGQVSAALAPFVARVIAVDASAAMLQAAKKRLARLRQRRPAPRRARSAADRRRAARCRDADAGAASRAGAGARARGSGARAQAGRPRSWSSTCCRTIARATASRWATSGSGFRDEHMRRMLAEAGFDDDPHRRRSPPDAERQRVRDCSSQRRERRKPEARGRANRA